MQIPEQKINDLHRATVRGKKWIYCWKDSLEAQRNLHKNMVSTLFRNSMLWTSQLPHDNGVWFSCFCGFNPLAFVNILRLTHCSTLLSFIMIYKVIVQLILKKNGFPLHIRNERWFWVRILWSVTHKFWIQYLTLLSNFRRVLGNSVILINCLV